MAKSQCGEKNNEYNNCAELDRGLSRGAHRGRHLLGGLPAALQRLVHPPVREEY